jgi:hypothetical protein
MGYSKREIILAAFEEIGIASYVFDLQAEQLQSALRKLDSMMSMWESKGIRIGYTSVSTPDNSDMDDQSGLPSKAIEAVTLNLAIRLAPSFGKSVPMEIHKGAKQAYVALLSASASPVESVLANTLPLGAGSKIRGGFITPLPDNIDLQDDSILEFN